MCNQESLNYDLRYFKSGCEYHRSWHPKIPIWPHFQVVYGQMHKLECTSQMIDNVTPFSGHPSPSLPWGSPCHTAGGCRYTEPTRDPKGDVMVRTAGIICGSVIWIQCNTATYCNRKGSDIHIHIFDRMHLALYNGKPRIMWYDGCVCSWVTSQNGIV